MLHKTIRALAAELKEICHDDAELPLRERFPIAASLAAFARRMGEPAIGAGDEAPIFIFASGWRSGSTYLQRLLMAPGTALIWGEPYDRARFVDHLASSMRFFDDRWPQDDFFLEGKSGYTGGIGGLAGEWVANLYPPPASVAAAHVAFILELLKVPAERLGAQRWGLKEVRLTIEHALYLKWLFPGARFVFLYRNPYDAYLSYRTMRGPWYSAYPDRPVRTGTAFGRQWRMLVEGFVSGCAAVDGHLVSYESLCSDERVRAAVLDYVGLPASDASGLARLRGGGTEKLPDREFLEREISRVELWALQRQVDPLARSLGYDRPTVASASAPTRLK